MSSQRRSLRSCDAGCHFRSISGYYRRYQSESDPNSPASESRFTGLRGMALHEVIQKLDFRQPAQQLLASSACIGLGALAAYQGTTTTPAGLLAGVLGVIGANVLSTDVHGAVTRRLGRAKQVFRNHDLTQVVGKAIGLVIEKVAEDPRLSGEQSGLRRLAKAAPGYWDTY